MGKQGFAKKWKWCAGLLAACLILTACSDTKIDNENAAEGQKMENIDAAEADKEEISNEKKHVDKNKKDKEETVYVTANADGSVKKIEVETVLKSADKTAEIQDYSILQNIRNTKGDEEFTQEDGILIWENKGEDISYKGETEEELPVSVHISYYLDGREMEPQEMAGVTGEVKIRFDYENHVLQTVQERGEETTVCVPFTAITALALPADTFFGIDVDGGKLASMGEQNMIIGMAYPGLGDSLKLAEYEPAKDISLQDYVEISAYAEDFSLSFTDTIITTGTFSDMDLETLEDVDELTDSMRELSDSADELEKAMTELEKGAGSFGNYLDSFLQGVAALEKGAGQLTEGIRTLNDSKGQLLDSAKSLQGGLEALDSQLAAIENIPGMEEQKELMSKLKELKAAAAQLAAGSAQLTTGLESFNGGLGQAYEGAASLQSGAAELENLGSKLDSGFGELRDGIGKLQDGMETFNEEGIQEITKLAGDDLSALVTRVRALQKADSMYYNYAGICEEQTGSVRFIIETEAIE